MKYYIVKKEINGIYYNKMRGYIQDTSLALLGTGLYCSFKNQIDLNNPSSWIIGLFIFISFLFFISWDLKDAESKIFIKPSNHKYKSTFSILSDISVRFMIGVNCASFYDWMLATHDKDLHHSIVFLITLVLFDISVMLFGYFTINIENE